MDKTGLCPQRSPSLGAQDKPHICLSHPHFTSPTLPHRERKQGKEETCSFPSSANARVSLILVHTQRHSSISILNSLFGISISSSIKWSLDHHSAVHIPQRRFEVLALILTVEMPMAMGWVAHEGGDSSVGTRPLGP